MTGTVVTGAGPHSGGGKRDDVSRFDLRIPDVARVHGTTVMIFLGAVLVMVWLMRRDRAPRNVQSRVTLLLVVLVAQADGRLRAVLQQHPRGAGRRAHRRRHRGVERDRGALPRDVRTDARLRDPTACAASLRAHPRRTRSTPRSDRGAVTVPLRSVVALRREPGRTLVDARPHRPVPRMVAVAPYLRGRRRRRAQRPEASPGS